MSTTPPPAFADLVRRCRHDRGETQAVFADASNGAFSQQQVSHWETGYADRPRTPEVVATLAELCNLAPAAVLASTGYPGATAALNDEITAAAQANPTLREIMTLAATLPRLKQQALLTVARAMRDA